MIETKKEQEFGVLVAVAPKFQPDEKTQEYLDELEFLVQTLDIQVEKAYTQKLEHPDTRTYVGKGKLEEICEFVKAKNIGNVIFDDDLSPSQLRNLERELKVKVYDRSLLILDIFLKRAQTNQAKTQVELARYQYLLPRLTRMWTHLERQRGGTATRGGAGEKEIETDRRNIRNQINILRKKLDKIETQAATRRKSRDGIVRVALVGYTNAGKSSWMQLLSKEDVYAKDELFATVDSTVRKVVLNQIPFLLSDTVGFIRKLPHNLIESFKSTLEEVKEADILLHIIDASNPSYEEHISVVEQTLEEIGAADIKTIKVYNKVDKIEDLAEFNPEGSQNSKENIFVSAYTKYHLEEFRDLVREYVQKEHLKIYPNYLLPEQY
ncbi:MAG: GTPase HflX [Flammeovirgaceae bacterium]|nr:GTPase HflX [Flammeovirgaceae bacterium]MBE63883.1 GTPase HflX [Flammeovirgaceae bacterium]MBR09412.1 GTPase HflX [Rickettsiales bacterium]HCX21861.1 GTPase HflX [Cytophagales bacterium]|tara:strand:- start:4409 stop:5548 length:1140 start_codon:yes stop_codon:yes gene_type:complete